VDVEVFAERASAVSPDVQAKKIAAETIATPVVIIEVLMTGIRIEAMTC
jgi:hypothetical protein